MAKKGNAFLLGLVLLVVGAGLVWWGYNEAGSLGGRIGRALSGSPSDRVMAFYIGGAVSAIVGLTLMLRK